MALLGAGSAVGQSAARPTFAPHRFDEDWRGLCTSVGRSEPLDALKCLMLGPAVMLSFGGEARARYEAFDNPGFGLRSSGHDVLLNRFLFHGDLRVSDTARAFLQFGYAWGDGRDGASLSTDTDRLDAVQAFLEVSTEIGPGRATLRGGRQELSFGSSRLISTREGANVRRSFDGVRAFWMGAGARLDVLYAQPVNVSSGRFDNRVNDSEALWGAYLTSPISGATGAAIDFYYLGYERDGAVFAAGSGNEQRHTVGARLFGATGGFDWDLEAAVQFGRFDDRDIRAWTVATEMGYTFGGLPLQPRLGLKADIASGDRRASDGQLGTFNALYPKLPYFSEANLIAPANLIDLQPSLSLVVAPTVELRLAWNGVWRHRTEDAVYGTPLVPIRGTAGRPGRFTGHQIIVGLGWQVTSSLILAAEYVHFAVGGALRRAGGQDVDFLKLSAAYRF